PDPRDLWDPVADDRHPAEPIRHRDDGRDPQRRPRWGPVGLLRDYAEEPDEWRHRGGRDQHHPDLFRRSARPDRRHRRDPRRNPRGGEAVPPLVPTRLGRHFRPGTPKLRQRSSSPFFDLYSSPGPSHENHPTTSLRLGPVTSLGCVEPSQLRRRSAYSGGCFSLTSMGPEPIMSGWIGGRRTGTQSYDTGKKAMAEPGAIQ